MNLRPSAILRRAEALLIRECGLEQAVPLVAIVLGTTWATQLSFAKWPGHYLFLDLLFAAVPGPSEWMWGGLLIGAGILALFASAIRSRRLRRICALTLLLLLLSIALCLIAAPARGPLAWFCALQSHFAAVVCLRLRLDA